MIDWIKIIIVAGAIVVGVGVKFLWKEAKDDNPVEEAMEFIIHEETGWDVDLTPSTKEKERDS